MYYPRYTGIRHPTVCDTSKELNEAGGCTNVDVKCENDKPKNCAVTAISHYTTSFNWAQGTNAAVWLRFGWLMFDHGFISDVQGTGITEVSGGVYSRPNLPIGYWALVSNSIFVGATQPGVGAASATRPAGCKAPDAPFDKFCLDEGGSTGFPLADTDMMLSQRLYSIYDGPSYQDANAYLDIKSQPCLSRETCIGFNAPDELALARAAPDGVAKFRNPRPSCSLWAAAEGPKRSFVPRAVGSIEGHRRRLPLPSFCGPALLASTTRKVGGLSHGG